MTSSIKIPSLGFNPPKDPGLNIELLTIEELKKRGSTEGLLKTNRANFYRLIGINAGQTSPVVDFTRYHAQSKHWLLVRPGQVLQYDFVQAWAGWLLVFKPESLFSGARMAGVTELTLLQRVERFPNHWVLTDEQLRSMRRALKLIHSDSQLPANSDTRNELMQHQLAALLLRLSIWQDAASAQAPAASVGLDHFKRFRQLLERDFHHAHLVKHYAQHLGMGEKNLSRASMAGSGVNAKTYIAQRLVLEAKRLLAHTTLPIQGIALELGFEDTANFVRFFKRVGDCTPGEFRLSQKAGILS
jgi:AraC-like DNA-binding protein